MNLLVDNVDKKQDVKQIVKLIVTQDEPLFGFAYFVSCNSQFGNTWSYLRKQTIGYQEKLVDLFFFFTNIVKAVNQLQELDAEYKKAEFIFNDLFVLSFNEYARPKMTLEWSKFDHLLHVKDGFTIAVRKDKRMLFSMYCKFVDEEQDDVQQRPILVFIDKLKKIWKGYFHE